MVILYIIYLLYPLSCILVFFPPPLKQPLWFAFSMYLLVCTCSCKTCIFLMHVLFILKNATLLYISFHFLFFSPFTIYKFIHIIRSSSGLFISRCLSLRYIPTIRCLSNLRWCIPRLLPTANHYKQHCNEYLCTHPLMGLCELLGNMSSIHFNLTKFCQICSVSGSTLNSSA